MRRVAIGDVTEKILFLKRSGIVVPDSDAATANLADYIQQPDAQRNRVSPTIRIAEVKQAQVTWINKPVEENGTGRRGIVRYLMIRRGRSNCFDTKTRDRTVFLAVVDWDNGGCSKGMTVSQLSLVSIKPKPRTKASA